MDLELYILLLREKKPKYSTELYTVSQEHSPCSQFPQIVVASHHFSSAPQQMMLKSHPPDGSAAFQVQDGLVQCSGKRQYKLVSGTFMCYDSSFWRKYATMLMQQGLSHQRQTAHPEVNPAITHFHAYRAPCPVNSKQNTQGNLMK